MGLSASFKAIAIGGAVAAAFIGMAIVCADHLLDQIKLARASKQMKSLYLAVAQYSIDHGDYCPNDLGALIDSNYCPAGMFYRLDIDDKDALPKNGNEVRDGKCDFMYFAKGMKMPDSSADSSKKSDGSTLGSFPLFTLKKAYCGVWLVAYSDGFVETYDSKPGFLTALEKSKR